jgi:hypothetical protein
MPSSYFKTCFSISFKLTETNPYGINFKWDCQFLFSMQNSFISRFKVIFENMLYFLQ